jgi:hypothetical protein
MTDVNSYIEIILCVAAPLREIGLAKTQPRKVQKG